MIEKFQLFKIHLNLSNTSLFIKKVCRYARKRLLTSSKSENDGSMASEDPPHMFIMCSHEGYAGRVTHSSYSMGYAVKSNLCCCLCIHTIVSFCHAISFSVKSVLK